MSGGKKNPRRVPATQAEVNRAFNNGLDKGCQLMLDLMVFTIGTDMEVSDEWIDKFHDRLMAHIDSFGRGYITQKDLREASLQERGWEVKIVG